MSTFTETLPFLIDRLEVRAVERVSPSFVRLELGGDCLSGFGVEGPLLDQRFKIVFPNALGNLPSFEDANEDWWTSWLEIPEDERGSMRTYTIRDVVGSGDDRRLVVDIVVHEGATGPGNAWALAAKVGDELITIAPRAGVDFGGIEFATDAKRVLLVGDEAAAPAIYGILRDLPADTTGIALIEVPHAADRLTDFTAPAGVEVVWLAREDGPRGSLLRPAVLGWLAEQTPVTPSIPVVEIADDEVDPDLWETPAYSSSGEAVGVETPTESPYAGLYAWIAGESKVVTGLRRSLVKDLGLTREQVAFMGYWREGVAMRS